MIMADLELENTQPEEQSVMLTVLCIGDPFSYTVPSFPAFTARVRCMKFELEGIEGEKIKKVIHHGLIRDCPQVKSVYPALALVQPGIPNGFWIEVRFFKP